MKDYFQFNCLPKEGHDDDAILVGSTLLDLQNGREIPRKDGRIPGPDCNFMKEKICKSLTPHK